MSSNRIENGLVNMAKSKMTSGSVKREALAERTQLAGRIGRVLAYIVSTLWHHKSFDSGLGWLFLT